MASNADTCYENAETFGRVTLLNGDCLDRLRDISENSLDSCACDPPYHLASIVKRFGKQNSAAPSSGGATGVYKRSASGFMGKEWDGGDVAFQAATWKAVLRVLKPGAYLLAFSGTRTYHRMVCAIEDAGFIICDQVAWVFGTGFPKSHNLKDNWQGFGTALKPAWEPVCLARKPVQGTIANNVDNWGVGALNIDTSRIDDDGTRDLGRWPANLVHDGSEEVVGHFPQSTSGALNKQQNLNGGFSGTKGIFGRATSGGSGEYPACAGSAARFFYSAKADRNDRIGSKHPTIKPVDLMRYLIGLITPPGGTVLDPFAGTGTTGEAAVLEGMDCILIEREQEYQNDIARRMALMSAGPEEKLREIIKHRGDLEDLSDTALFGEVAE